MTDHANLVYIDKSTNVTINWWKTTLDSYEFVVKHIQGVKNVVADFLSKNALQLSNGRRTEDNWNQRLPIDKYQFTLFRMAEIRKVKIYKPYVVNVIWGTV